MTGHLFQLNDYLNEFFAVNISHENHPSMGWIESFLIYFICQYDSAFGILIVYKKDCRGKNDMAKLTLQELESHLWESANILRGSIDSSDYKNYIFGLL